MKTKLFLFSLGLICLSTRAHAFDGLEQVTRVSETKVQLRWTPSLNSRTDSYNIYDVLAADHPHLLMSVKGPAREYILDGVTPGELHFYRVEEVDATGVEDGNLVDRGVSL